MGVRSTVVFCFSCFAAVTSSMVELSSQWKENMGWEVTCGWRLLPNDALQSVRLRDDGRQFMVYRPEIHGPDYKQSFNLRPQRDFHVHCYESSDRGNTGMCIMVLELYEPMVQDVNYTCEVSGERPTFRMETKDIVIEALVPPSKAIVTGSHDEATGRVTVNCSSSGLPAPTLVWTIGDQKIPQDFSQSVWNITSRLWHAWSLLSYTPNENAAVCTPEVTRGRLIRGESVEYNAAGILNGALTTIVLSKIMSILLS